MSFKDAETRREYMKKYRAKNRERINATRRKYYASHKEQYMESQRKYRAKKAEAGQIREEHEDR